MIFLVLAAAKKSFKKEELEELLIIRLTKLAQQIRNIPIEDCSIHISASIGISTYPMDGKTLGELYEISPEWFYRPDVFSNLQDQTNVALSGFACLVNMDAMPAGRYEVGILVTDKTSKHQCYIY